MSEKRLFSGIQPSGPIHLGNYLGAIKQWVEYQHDWDAYFSVVDLHALVARPGVKDLRERTLDTLAMLIAIGIDPKSATLFVQSDVPAHSELAWIMNCFTSIGQLSRMTQYKEKSETQGETAGLFNYPVLQAADIALYNAEVVPVGDDQLQHLELAREIVRSLNSYAGKEILVEPKPLLNKSSRIMALNNPEKKMSKSVSGSAIGLLDSEDEVARVIKRAVTDSDPNSSTPSGALKNLFTILESVSDVQTIAKFEEMRVGGHLRYSELKEQLIDDVVAFLRPIQQTYKTLRADTGALNEIRLQGAKKAEVVASDTLQKVKSALGLN
ncbi:tryptophan--tRNA ligase [Candidatus Berkelbacteria bacterium]|nr:tryptophan--tRNA ligase [Candidatus Berkelbacteria bacterium]